MLNLYTSNKCVGQETRSAIGGHYIGQNESKLYEKSRYIYQVKSVSSVQLANGETKNV